MYNEVITLISEVKTTDSYGDTSSTITGTEVFARCQSISQTEFYQAQATGLKPEIKFVIADFLDYSGQKLLKYKPYGGVEEVYTIIRTYRAGNTMELTCKRGVDE